MGSACCVAARDRTITNGSSSNVMPRNIRYSPSWSVQWDNRRRVAGEETSMNWSSDLVGTNDRLDMKSQTTVGTAYASEEGSPLESSQNRTYQKASPSEGYMIPHSDQPVSKIFSEAKGSREAQLSSEPSPSTHSVSSFSASLSSSQDHQIFPSASTQSDNRIPVMKSPNFSFSKEGSPMLPGSRNKSKRRSHGGSSDSWPVPAFNDPMATSHREQWSFDDRVSSSTSIDIQTCGICSKLLSEKSYWGSQKIITTNELLMAAILICGHAYHAECLENMTSESNKYDPECPVCTYGEKQALKLYEKALKADMESKGKIRKKSRRQEVVDGDMNVMFDGHKSSRTHKLSSSSSMKTFGGNRKPFLKRHFSFGSKGLSENNSSWKKGYFWAKSGKE